MNLRRHLLLLVLITTSAQGWTQVYPSKPVRYLVPDAAGSGSDTIGRIIATGLSAGFGQQVVVDNRPGATGTIGADIAAKTPPDGYTVLQMSSALAAAQTLYRNLPYDLLRDFIPVTQLAAAPQIVVVHPSVPAKSMSELVALAKKRPDELVYGSAGSASSTHLAAEMFKAQAGVNMLHVPYRGGGQAITAVVSGETSVYFAPVAAALPFIRQARLRPLAVTTAKRIPLLPEIPTVSEAGIKGYQTAQWYGVLVPAKTSKSIVATIHQQTVATLKSAAVTKRLHDLGYIIVGDQPDEFSAYLRSEVERLGQTIKSLNLKAD